MLRITFENAYHGRKTGRFGDSQHGYYFIRRSHYTGYYYRYAWNPAFKRTFNAVQQAQIDRFTAASNLCNQLWKSEIERCRYEALFARYQHIQMLHPTWQKETVLYVMGVISEMPKSGTNSRKRAKNPYYRTARQLCMSIAYLRLSLPSLTTSPHKDYTYVTTACMSTLSSIPLWGMVRVQKENPKSSAIKCTFWCANVAYIKKKV